VVEEQIVIGIKNKFGSGLDHNGVRDVDVSDCLRHRSAPCATEPARTPFSTRSPQVDVDVAKVLEGALQNGLGDAVKQVANDIGDAPLIFCVPTMTTGATQAPWSATL
jgi:hypothetical protein